MSNDYNSVRKHFLFDKERSSILDGNYFFQFLGEYYLPSNKDEDYEERIYVIIENLDITFKQEILFYNNNQLIATKLNNLLVIPKSTKHHNFLNVETQLIRLKREDEKYQRQKKQRGIATFKELLLCFIEDLYVHKYFKDSGNANEIKSSIEHIPLLQGIISKFLFDYYSEACLTIRKRDWKMPYKRENFEDAYLNYSKFLSQPQHERIFQKGGWFVKDMHEQKLNDIDAELFRIEKTFLAIEDKLEKDNFLFSDPVNIKHILKRYGIVNVLKIALPNWVWRTFVMLLSGLILFILGDIASFNLKYNEQGIVQEWMLIETFFEKAVEITSFVFLIFSGVVFLWLFYKYKMRVIPGIFLPRLVIAIISGWVVFFTAEELLKIDIDINGWILLGLLIIVFLVTIMFMIFEINNYAPAMGWGKIIKRSLIVTGLAFVVSYTFGFWTMTHINEKFMSFDNFVVNESSFKNTFEDRLKQYDYQFNNSARVDSVINFNIHVLDSMTFEMDIDKNTLSVNNNEDDLKKISRISAFSNIDLIDKLDDDDINNLEGRLRSHLDSLNNKIDEYNKLIQSIESKTLKLGDEKNLSYFNLHFENIDPADINKCTLVDIGHKPMNINHLKLKYNNLKSTNHYLIKFLANNPDVVVNKRQLHAKNYNFNIAGKEIEHVTFPNMLLTRALLAMFVGIFLQLIIQDKTITEPI